MPLDTDLEKLVLAGIINNEVAGTITVGVGRERSETYTKGWCPLADQLESMVEKATKKPSQSVDILTEVLIMINKRNNHFGQ